MPFLKISLFFSVLIFMSCQSEVQRNAQTAIKSYSIFVDSVSTANFNETAVNWESIHTIYLDKKNAAEKSVALLQNNTELVAEIETIHSRFKSISAKIQPELERIALENAQYDFRASLLTNGDISDDLNMEWLNRRNIALVYQQFVRTVENQKDSFTATQWNEVERLFDAMDKRRIQLVKEGIKTDEAIDFEKLKSKYLSMLKSVTPQSEEANKN